MYECFVFLSNSSGVIFITLVDWVLVSTHQHSPHHNRCSFNVYTYLSFTEASVTDDDKDLLLRHTNELLSRVNIIQGRGKHLKSIHKIDVLKKSASSMFVAIFEALFHVQLVDIFRSPNSLQDYVANAEAVINALRLVFDMSLSHIKGKDIATGNITAISNLVDILMGISHVKNSQEEDEEGKPQRRNHPSLKQRKKEAASAIAGGKGSNGSSRGENGRRERSKRTPMQRKMYSAPTAAPGDKDGRRSTMQKRNGGPQRKWPKSWPPIIEKEKENLVEEPPLDDDEPDTDVSQSTHSSSRRRRDVSMTDSGVVQEDGDTNDAENLPPPGPNPDFSPTRVSNAQDSNTIPRFKGTHTGGKLTRLEEEHEKRALAIYKRVLKERQTDLRQRELADEKKQFYAYRNAKHAAKVRKIKQDRMNEYLRLRKASFRMKHENQHGKHILHTYKRILSIVHQQKRENDREDAARLKALYDCHRSQEDNLEQFFIERLRLVTEHQKEMQAERKTALKSEEGALDRLLLTTESAYEERLRKAMTNLDQMEEALLRAGEEKFYSFAQILGAEDWSTTSNDRFMSTPPSTAFALRMKVARKGPNAAQAFIRRRIVQHGLIQAYGQGRSVAK